MIVVQNLPEAGNLLLFDMKTVLCDRNYDLLLAVNMKTGSGMLGIRSLFCISLLLSFRSLN